MTNRSHYLTVTQRHPVVYGVTVIAALGAVGTVIGIGVTHHATVTLAAVGWTIAAWLIVCLAQEQRVQRRAEQRLAAAQILTPTRPPMGVDKAVNGALYAPVGDEERAVVLGFLGDLYVAGDLNDDEHGARHTRALYATTVAGLRVATEGLLTVEEQS